MIARSMTDTGQGSWVPAATAHPQQLGLTAQCQPVAAVDHRFARSGQRRRVRGLWPGVLASPIGAVIGRRPSGLWSCIGPAPVRIVADDASRSDDRQSPRPMHFNQMYEERYRTDLSLVPHTCRCRRRRRVQGTASVQKIVLPAVARVQETGHETPAGKLAAGYPPESQTCAWPVPNGPGTFCGVMERGARGSLLRGFGHLSGVANAEAARR